LELLKEIAFNKHRFGPLRKEQGYIGSVAPGEFKVPLKPYIKTADKYELIRVGPIILTL
jgi:hypothetical protein